jgi:type VI secretion system protein ImpA
MTAHLLDPISPAAPTGFDLSFSPEFDQITELRRFDDPTLDQGEWVRDIKSADWSGVASLCVELLNTRTKDLRLAGWMTEALARTRGFAGMAEGLEVCAGLCESFWDELHPLPDEDAPTNELAERFEQRIGNLKWLLTQLTEVAQTQPLIAGKDTSASHAGYGRRTIEALRSRKAADPNNTSELNEEQVALNVALAHTPGDALWASLEGAQAALAALARLQAVIDGHLGLDGPTFSAARDALQDTHHMLARFAKERGLLAQPEGGGVASVGDVAGDASATASAQAGGTPVFAGGAPTSRAQALAQLRAVAEYFRRTEPHSPVAYLAEKAAKWGEVPLHLWLRSVMKDPASLAQIEEMLGIEPPQE